MFINKNSIKEAYITYKSMSFQTIPPRLRRWKVSDIWAFRYAL